MADVLQVVTPALLAAADVDTPSEGVQFAFGGGGGADGGRCGHWTTGANGSPPVTTFTQRQIDDGQVAFVHHGNS